MSNKRWKYGVSMEFKQLVPQGFIREVTDHPNLMILHIEADFRGVITLIIVSDDFQELTAFSKHHRRNGQILVCEIIYRGDA